MTMLAPVPEAKAAAAGKREIDPADYVPACVESCPTGAIVFGDLNDPASEVAKAAQSGDSFRLLEKLHTEPKIHYRSRRDWVRRSAERPMLAVLKTETTNG